MDVTTTTAALATPVEVLVTQYRVLKPFNTVNRRLAPSEDPENPGSLIDTSEDVSPMTFEALVAKGFIEEKTDALRTVEVSDLQADPLAKGPEAAVAPGRAGRAARPIGDVVTDISGADDTK